MILSVTFTLLYRTSLELKHNRVGYMGQSQNTFNRTSLELKPERDARLRGREFTFNRTSLELKPISGFFSVVAFSGF